MMKFKITLIATIALFCQATVLLVAQSKLRPATSDYKYGIGLKLGDPLAISGKYYFGKSALELNIGSSWTRWGGRDYYYYYNKDNRYGSKGAFYGGSRRSALAIQLHYLLNYKINLPDLPGKWNWYWGAGPQVRIGSYDILYRDAFGNIRRDTYTDVDFGADAVIGTEYFFKDIPLSLSLDINAFLEIVDELNGYFQGGLGVRYNF